MSLEQQIQLTNTSLESEKSHSKALSEELVSKTESLAAAQKQVQELETQLNVASKKAEESNEHVKILATSCNESKITIATKEKVIMFSSMCPMQSKSFLKLSCPCF